MKRKEVPDFGPVISQDFFLPQINDYFFHEAGIYVVVTFINFYTYIP